MSKLMNDVTALCYEKDNNETIIEPQWKVICFQVDNTKILIKIKFKTGSEW